MLSNSPRHLRNSSAVLMSRQLTKSDNTGFEMSAGDYFWTNLSSLALEASNLTSTYFEDVDASDVNASEPSNGTDAFDDDDPYDYWPDTVFVVTAVLLGLLILCTIIGNVFVIAAIFLEKNLQSVGNYLVLSLAVADLLVACLVMPLGAVYEVTQEWPLGPELCDMWTSSDVLCCTASILHLLAIAMDRFWAVTNVDYIHNRNATRIGLMIVVVWAVAFIVSIAPIFGWKDPDFQRRIQVEKRCLVSQDVAYQVFATCSTFYVPLILILLLYWRIYQAARKRIRHKPGSKAVVPARRRPPPRELAPLNTEMSTLNNLSSSVHPSPERSTSTNGLTSPQEDTGREQMLLPPAASTSAGSKRSAEKKQRRETIESKRERKAAKTLAIITGVFVICWLPFFVVALLMPLCESCQPNNYLFSFFLWLGYANSLLNPIIYTIFSPDFRNAFRRILCGKQRYRRTKR